MTIAEAYDQEIEMSHQIATSDQPPLADYLQQEEMNLEQDETSLEQDKANLQPDEMRPLTGHVFSRNEKWPVVRFENGKVLLCVALAFTVEGPLANLEARQTLERVKINLGSTFEKGQAYVAISRATSMEGLELHNFDPSKVMAHPFVNCMMMTMNS
ncbi:hypothetical protein BJ912DRAFT_343704 [Pholiota molesta]|nr:hypothetical protein BJ912DRAFT_343704 [Pholiota molesta]